MPDPADRQRRFNFTEEGFLIFSDEAGLEIHVTDYHARPLKLPWATLDGWRTESSPVRAAAPPQGPPSEPPPRFSRTVPALPGAGGLRGSRRKRRR